MTTVNCSGLDYLARMARIVKEIEADPDGVVTTSERLTRIETPMLAQDEVRRRSAAVTSLKEALASGGAPLGATLN